MNTAFKKNFITISSLILTLGGGFALKWYFHFNSQPFFIAFTNSDIWDFWSRISGGVSTNLLSSNIWKLEYPILTKGFIYLTYNFTSSLGSFFSVTGIIFSLLIVLTTLMLYQIIKKEKLPFWRLVAFWALAPSLLIYAFFNWDILSVFCVTASIYFFKKGNNKLTGLFIALGTSFKLFPILLLLPAILEKFKDQKKKEALEILLSFIFVSLVVNLPQMITDFSSWSYFITFNTPRIPMHLESVWVGLWVASDKIFGGSFYLRDSYGTIVNQVSSLSFIIGYFVLLFIFFKKKGSVFVTASFVGILWFLLTNKIFSPQYTLWLLPFYVVLPTSVLFTILVEASSFFVFYGAAQYLYYNYVLRLAVSPGNWFEWTYLAVLARHVGLLGLMLKSLKK